QVGEHWVEPDHGDAQDQHDPEQAPELADMIPVVMVTVAVLIMAGVVVLCMRDGVCGMRFGVGVCSHRALLSYGARPSTSQYCSGGNPGVRGARVPVLGGDFETSIGQDTSHVVHGPSIGRGNRVVERRQVCSSKKRHQHCALILEDASKN